MQEAELDQQLDRLQDSVLQVYQAIGASLSEATEVSPTQYMVLRLVRKKPRTAGELAEVLGVSPSAVTALVGRLEEADLVARERSAADRRCVNITLSSHGQEFMKGIHDKRLAVIGCYLKQMDDQDIVSLVKCCEKLAAIVKANEESTIYA